MFLVVRSEPEDCFWRCSLGRRAITKTWWPGSLAGGGETMPLTPFQSELGLLLARNRSEDSYLAGGAAILAAPNTRRYSQDLDYFQDSSERVASAFASDRATLESNGYTVEPEISQPGYVRAVIRREGTATKVEWAQDSSWRFMPVIKSDAFGYQLHPIDLATNKVLALAGREEPRDLVDTVYLHQNVLGLGPLAWAATGKDPGFSPSSLLEMLRRRGKIRPEELSRLHLSEPIDVKTLKLEWLAALEAAESFISGRPPDEAGCLYYSGRLETFVDPGTAGAGLCVAHFGRPGGVLPAMLP